MFSICWEMAIVVRLRANIYLSRLIVGILFDGRYRVRFVDKFSRFFSEINCPFTCSFVDVTSVLRRFLFVTFRLFALFSQFLLFLLENREPLLL